MADSPLHLSTLPQAQRALWPTLGEIRNGFILYGGTGLALHLGHRQSVDFDFFTTRHFQPDGLRTDYSLLRDAEVLQAAADTLVVLKPGTMGDVKLSFFGGLDLARAASPVTSRDNGMRIASLLDLAGTKVKVVQDRAELKDYLDLAAIFRHGITLSDALSAAMTIYGANFNPMVSLKALVYFEEGDVSRLSVEDRKLLENQAARVNIGTLAPVSAARCPLDAAGDQTEGFAMQIGLKP